MFLAAVQQDLDQLLTDIRTKKPTDVPFLDAAVLWAVTMFVSTARQQVTNFLEGWFNLPQED